MRALQRTALNSSPQHYRVALQQAVAPRLILVCLAVLLVAGFMLPSGAPPPRHIPGGIDLALYRGVVARVAAGEPYYPVLNAELRARKYPTDPVFNWRLPGAYVALAKAPELMRALFIVGLGLIMAGTAWLFRDQPRWLTAALVLQCGVIAGFATPLAMYFLEVWAAIPLALSVLAFASGLSRVGIVFGLLAVATREIALPYACIGLGIAMLERHWADVRLWLIGFVALAIYYAVHVWIVSPYIAPGDLRHESSWFALGGWPFVVRTVGAGGWYLLLPPWAASIGATLIAASPFAPNAPKHLTLTAVGYLACYAVVGLPFNGYWGLLLAPVWAIATVYGCVAVVSLTVDAVIGERRLAYTATSRASAQPAGANVSQQ